MRFLLVLLSCLFIWLTPITAEARPSCQAVLKTKGFLLKEQEKMSQEEIKALIRKYANYYKVPAKYCWGVLRKESTENPIACRYEKNYQWLYNPKDVKPKLCSLDTEVALQKMSLGLMQVMGAVFREYGYSGWLSGIFTDTEAQIKYGCKHLAKKIAKYGAEKGISAYNAGSPTNNNRQYVVDVLAFSKEWSD